jgi:hypothetical protein
MRLNKIFWIDETVAQTCEERLKRLAYIRAVFINWITDYKLMHHAVPTAVVSAHTVGATA